MNKTWELYTDRQRWTFLFVLFLISTSNVIDRQLVPVLLEPIKKEFQVSDLWMGLLSGVTFAIFYVSLGIPIARIADRKNRKVIIGVSMTVWSVMTALCGAAQNFWQLALARIGVGAGEAGCVPPAQSLLADYMPPDKRSMALAIFFLSAAVGNVLGLIVGGQIAELYGWRWAFIAFGLPGLLVCAIAMLVLDEPRKLSQFKIEESKAESFKTAVSVLKNKQSFVNSVIAMVLYYMMMYGVLTFSISFLMRSQSLSLGDASMYYGIVTMIAALVGNISGGFITDKFGSRDLKLIAKLPAMGFVIVMPISIFAYMVKDLNQLLILLGISSTIMMAAAPSIFSCLHAVCGNARRATAIAIAYFFANLIGVGLGPVLAGLLSDIYASYYGPSDGLRYSLITMSIFYLPAAWFLWKASKTIEIDKED